VRRLCAAITRVGGMQRLAPAAPKRGRHQQADGCACLAASGCRCGRARGPLMHALLDLAQQKCTSPGRHGARRLVPH
jgi:hypothetical protein